MATLCHSVLFLGQGMHFMYHYAIYQYHLMQTSHFSSAGIAGGSLWLESTRWLNSIWYKTSQQTLRKHGVSWAEELKTYLSCTATCTNQERCHKLLKMVLLQHSLQYVNILTGFGYQMGNVLPTDMWTLWIWQSTFRLWHSWVTIHLHGGYNLRWRFSSSGMWCYVIGCVAPDISKEWRRVPLLEPWKYSTTILCIISNYTLHTVTPQKTKIFSSTVVTTSGLNISL